MEAQAQQALGFRVVLAKAFDAADALDQGSELTADGLVVLLIEAVQLDGCRQ